MSAKDMSTMAYPDEPIDLNLPPFSASLGFTRTQPPNPQWKHGEGIEQSPLGKEWKDGEAAGWMTVDTLKADKIYLYKLMLSGVVPRPIAFVSTISAEGTANLAPFSWFNMVTHNPPLVSVSVAKVPSSKRGKDTAENIKATKTFTVNIISEPWAEQANFCSVNSPPEFSEWHASGLTMEPSTLVKPSRVKESAFSMECEVFQLHDLCPVGSSTPTATLVLGLVKLIHVRRDVLNEDGASVDPGKFRPISRLGSLTYGRVVNGFDLPRQRWDKTPEEVKVASGPNGTVKEM